MKSTRVAIVDDAFFIREGIRRVLSELPDPPTDWTEY